MVFVFSYHILGALGAFIDDFLDFAVDSGLYFFAVGLGVLHVWIGNIAQLIIHAEFGHQRKGQVVSLL